MAKPRAIEIAASNRAIILKYIYIFDKRYHRKIRSKLLFIIAKNISLRISITRILMNKFYIRLYVKSDE